MDTATARVRQFQPADLDDLYRICLQTADSGQDGTALFSDPELPGQVFAAPYVNFEPSLAFVAEDASGVAGYVVGALDSEAFAQRLERDWWPMLRARYPEPAADAAEGMSPQQRWAIEWIHHPLQVDQELATRYPSHLHINLLPRLQGSGYGRQLITTLTASLREQGSAGLHLHVSPRNLRAIGFYRHVGFTQVPATDVCIFGMELQAP